MADSTPLDDQHEEAEQFWFDPWSRGPDPYLVMARVGSLVARELKLVDDVHLGRSGHAGRMRLLLLAAEFYCDFVYQVMCEYVPPAARPVADLHLRFAE